MKNCVIIIEQNTEEIRTYLEENLGIRYIAKWPLKDYGTIISVDPNNKSYSTWKSTEKLLHILEVLKTEFHTDTEIINCNLDINKFYEETRKKI